MPDSIPFAAQGTRRVLPIVALLTANAISMTGNVLAIVGIPWFVLQMTGSAAQTGISGFFTILPVVIVAFFGSYIDRVGYRRTSILADITSGLAIAAIPLLYHSVGLAFWQLLALVFLGNLFDAPGNTARQALVPDLAKLAGLRLEQAGAATQAIERGSRLLGAPLAGLLIATFDASSILWIDAATFIVSALLVAAAVPSAQKRVTQEPHHYGRELLDGVRFIWRDRLVLAIILTVMVANFLDAPSAAVVLPVYAKERFGNALDLGLMFAAFGGGSLVGAILFGAVGHRLPRRPIFVLMFILVGLRFWVLAMFPSLTAILVTMAFCGFAAGPLNPIISTLEYERIPPNMRGRVLSTITAGAYMAMPFGVLVAGFVLEQIGLEWTLILLGLLYAITTLSLAINPALSEMDRADRVNYAATVAD